uniref:CNNM transmembrane domain-containing protein n=1 Tax=Panagrellus redivivus TaxID=6233 RepID=A0A7E4ZWC8_PANRE
MLLGGVPLFYGATVWLTLGLVIGVPSGYVGSSEVSEVVELLEEGSDKRDLVKRRVDGPAVYGLRIINYKIQHPYTIRYDDKLHFIGRNLGKIKQSWLSQNGRCHSFDSNLEVKLLKQNKSEVFFRRFWIPKSISTTEDFTVCISPGRNEAWKSFMKLRKARKSGGLYLPLYFQIPVVIACLALSALFSGLSVGLMSLSVSGLELIMQYDPIQAVYAQNILPLRKKGNFLQCTLLIGNTFVNNAATVLISNMISEFGIKSKMLDFAISAILPAFVIVVIGEIVPVTVCCRWGLWIGSYTRFITIFFMVLTAPVSYPMSMLLDCIIGKEGPESYDKAMLENLVEMNVEPQHGLSRTTADLVVRALNITKLNASSVMTPIEKVFMLPEEAVVDRDLVKRIHELGHTRIPIYRNHNRNMVTAIINVKDLVPIDPKCGLRMSTVVQVWQRSRHFRFVLEEFPIAQLLKEMKRGQPLALVARFNQRLKDYEVTGVIALEDIIEEITGEILDEKDVKHRHPRPANNTFRQTATYL